MKALKIFTLFILTSQVYGQISENCGINPTIYSNNGCSIRLNQLIDDKIDFYKDYCEFSKSYNSSEYNYIVNDSIFENNLFESYPLNFKKTSTGFEFKNKEGELLKVQKTHYNDNEPKQYQEYDIIAQVNNFIIISQSGYEWYHHLLIDLKNLNSYYFPGEPIFINSNLIYGYSNYYGSSDFKIINIEKRNDVSLSFENEILNAKHSYNSMGILLEFRNQDCKSNQFLNIVQ